MDSLRTMLFQFTLIKPHEALTATVMIMHDTGVVSSGKAATLYARNEPTLLTLRVSIYHTA